MSRLIVAAAQIECRPGDVAANLATHLDWIGQARRRGVELLVFPELSLTDYLAAPGCTALAMAADDARLRELAQAAGPMRVSLGFIERGADGRAFNAQALLYEGAVLAVHRKLNLPGYGRLREPEFYTAGTQLGLVSLEAGWRAATLICADSWNPALPWLTALSGANLLILPVASARDVVDGGFDNPRGWDINLAHTAMTYGLPTIFANHCGARRGRDFWGGSRLLDAGGRELARAGTRAELIVAALDFDHGRAARENLPTIRDSDPVCIHRLLGDHLFLSKA